LLPRAATVLRKDARRVRLRAKITGGYYPTPERVTQWLPSWLRAENGRGELRGCDPCCGTGRALAEVTRTLPTPVVTVGVEIHSGRAREAQDVLTRVETADVHTVRCTSGAFSLLFLNPPYDDDAAGRREEAAFLRQTLPWLAPRGVLAYLIPVHRLLHRQIATLLTTWCGDLTVVRFPDPEYAQFSQAIVLGRKQPRGVRDPAAAGHFAQQVLAAQALDATPLRRYTLPRLTQPWEVTAEQMDPIAAQQLVREHSPLWQTPEAQYYFGTTRSQLCRPLLPPRKAHVATLAAAGLLNNAVLTGPDGPRILKGSVRKQFRPDLTRSDDHKTVEREQVVITLKVITATGEITALT
jgi:16S rRNA G966 N2-methylase RsmD